MSKKILSGAALALMLALSFTSAAVFADGDDGIMPINETNEVNPINDTDETTPINETSGEISEPTDDPVSDGNIDLEEGNMAPDNTEVEDEEDATSGSEMWTMYVSLGALGLAILVFIILNAFGRKKRQFSIMIAHIAGIITEKFQNSVIVDVQGVGYELTISALDAENTNLDDQIKFYTYHSVRENGEDLYGFLSLAAKKLFEMLISVNGIGPKAAMSILSLGTPEDVRNAIANDDTAFISKASGVGKKSAERVIVDLRDKVGLPSHYGRTSAPIVNTKGPEDEALDALIALGFPLKEATAALADVDPNLSVEERVRQALQQK